MEFDVDRVRDSYMLVLLSGSQTIQKKQREAWYVCNVAMPFGLRIDRMVPGSSPLVCYTTNWFSCTSTVYRPRLYNGMVFRSRDGESWGRKVWRLRVGRSSGQCVTRVNGGQSLDLDLGLLH